MRELPYRTPSFLATGALLLAWGACVVLFLLHYW